MHIWLDYKKAFDSVPHNWLIESLQLAKVPIAIVTAIDRIAKTWSTNADLQTSEITITTEEIEYRLGILQGDALSVILFILSVNPSSFLPSKVKGGFKITDSKSLKHIFFVDDLKLLARSLTKAKLLLNIITTFSKDIGMTFGQRKCAYVYIERGNQKTLGATSKFKDYQ